MLPLLPMLRLMRPANLVTAVSDVLAGFSIAVYAAEMAWGDLPLPSLILLVFSTVCLYGGGVVLNDVFDAELDKIERPERPIPSGLISSKSAGIAAVLLLFAGVSAAAFAHPALLLSLSGLLAGAIAVAAVVYDKWGKHLSFFGPLNMGLCRGLNLALGISILPRALSEYWWLGIAPVLYIAAITAISRGEVHGSGKQVLKFAVALYVIVITSIFCIAWRNGALLLTLPFLALFAVMIFLPLCNAIQNPRGPMIGKAVKAGVIALILMNAAWAAAFGSFYFALLIILLLPLSILLGKVFMVT